MINVICWTHGLTCKIAELYKGVAGSCEEAPSAAVLTQFRSGANLGKGNVSGATVGVSRIAKSDADASPFSFGCTNSTGFLISNAQNHTTRIS